MKKSTAIIVTVIVVAWAGNLSAQTIKLSKFSINDRLQEAVAKGDAASAAQWAAAINSLHQAEAAKEAGKTMKTANQVLSVYVNALESVPAALEGVEHYASLAKDKDLAEVCKLGKILSTVLKRPIEPAEAKKAAEIIHANEVR